MYPILVDLGFTAIHTYGFLIATGFVLAVLLLRKKSHAAGLDRDKMSDMGLWGMIWGLLGARLLYVITRWSDFSQHPLSIFKFWEGGLVFYGGFISGVIAYAVLLKRAKIPVFKALDMTAPSLVLAHAFGRFGCFTAGCCFGKRIDADHPFALVFTHKDSIAPLGIPLHATQLYDAANTLIIFAILQILYRRKKFDGQVTAVYLALYAIGRSIVEVYRGDKIRGFVIDDVLSTSQFISIFMLIIAAWVWITQRKKTLKA